MSIVSIGPFFGQRGPRSRTQNQDWTRNYTLTYLVVTNDPTDGPVLVSSYVPWTLGQAYKGYAADGVTVKEHDNGSFVTSIQVAEDPISPDGCQWIATVEFGPFQANQAPQDPTQQLPTLSWTESLFQSPAAFDVNGNPILNAAFDWFNPPFMKDDDRPGFTLKRNEKAFDPTFAKQFANTLNQGIFWIFPAQWVKLKPITAERVLNNDIGWYYEVTYEFEVNPNTWAARLLNQGMRQVVSGRKTEILDNAGNLVSEPWPLDKTGAAIPEGSATEAVYLSFDVYPTADFSQLNFDSFFATLP